MNNIEVVKIFQQQIGGNKTFMMLGAKNNV